MSKLYRSFIKDFAAQLRKKVEDGMIAGEKVDLSDPDQCLIAGYYIGREEQYEEQQEDKKRAHMLGLS